MGKLSEEQSIILESLIDGSSLSDVLWTLEKICLEKSEHVASNWQDKPLAKSWDRDAVVMSKAAMKVNN